MTIKQNKELFGVVVLTSRYATRFPLEIQSRISSNSHCVLFQFHKIQSNPGFKLGYLKANPN